MKAFPVCARHHVRLGDEGALDDELPAVQLEDGVLRLDVDGESGRGEEVVNPPVATAEVGAAAVGEAEVRVLFTLCWR